MWTSKPLSDRNCQSPRLKSSMIHRIPRTSSSSIWVTVQIPALAAKTRKREICADWLKSFLNARPSRISTLNTMSQMVQSHSHSPVKETNKLPKIVSQLVHSSQLTKWWVREQHNCLGHQTRLTCCKEMMSMDQERPCTREEIRLLRTTMITGVSKKWRWPL